MIVTANNDAPVRLRSAPSGSIIASIAQGTEAKLLEVVDATWSKIEVNGVVGYMMSKYLVDKQAETQDLSELKAKLKEVLKLLDKLEA